MISSYLKITIRNIRRYKGYSFINIAGLAIGMTCTILISLWVADEINYDRFHEKSANIYRIIEKYNTSNESFAATYIPFPVAAALKEELPEVVDYTRFTFGHGKKLLSRGDKSFYERAYGYVDPSFFKIFTFPFAHGNLKSALSNPYSIVLTEQMAEKYFGEEDPLGKRLSLNNTYDLEVTGVIKNIPENSHLKFDFLAPVQFLTEIGKDYNSWDIGDYQGYILVRNGTDIKALNTKIRDYKKKHDPETKNQLSLQSLLDIHLHSDIKFDLARNKGDIQNVFIFSLIGILVLLIACINFMNLSTARAATRFREIGVRKVIGAKRVQFAGQFFFESFIHSFLAIGVAAITANVLLPWFNNLTGKQLNLPFSMEMIYSMIIITCFTGIAAGSYPAFFLSSFRPIDVIRDATRTGKSSRSSRLRRLLVVLQFGVSIVLVISALVASKQMTFVKNRELGFDKEHLIYLQMRGELSKRYNTIKSELLRHPEIIAVSAAGALPIYMGQSTSNVQWEGKNPDEQFMLNYYSTHYGYLQTMRMELAEGRDFISELSQTSDQFILNEEAVKQIGITFPVGKEITYSSPYGDCHGIVVGVVKDFHFQPLHQKIEPLLLNFSSEINGYLMIRIKGMHIDNTVQLIEKIWNKVNPQIPFEYNFLENHFKNMYRGEKRQGKILNGFSLLTIFIACLGLFGLISFMGIQRAKEIGIRKVFGASVLTIVLLFIRQFLKWIIFAFLLACPIAWILMNRWLQHFAYRTQMGIWPFIIAGGLVLFIALFTIGFHAIKAAITNPVDVLRYE